MSKIATLEPLAETLSFEGGAKRRIDRLLAVMLQMAKLIASSVDNGENDRHYDIYLRAQRQLAAANCIVAFIADVGESAHEQRRLLWESMPNQKPVLVIARCDKAGMAIVMTAERSHAKVTCTKFTLLDARALRAGGTT